MLICNMLLRVTIRYDTESQLGRVGRRPCWRRPVLAVEVGFSDQEGFAIASHAWLMKGHTIIWHSSTLQSWQRPAELDTVAELHCWGNPDHQRNPNTPVQGVVAELHGYWNTQSSHFSGMRHCLANHRRPQLAWEQTAEFGYFFSSNKKPFLFGSR